MPNSDPFTHQPEQPPERPVWGVFALFAAFWLILCVFAFALMMGWL